MHSAKNYHTEETPVLFLSHFEFIYSYNFSRFQNDLWVEGINEIALDEIFF